MNTTIIDICNQALFHLGLSMISDLDDKSDICSIACKLFFDRVLRKSLREHPWDFAKCEVALSPAENPELYPRYEYAYQYPKDCACIHKIVNPSGNDAKKIEYDVQISHCRTDKVILTNEPNAVLAYTVYTDDPSLFSDNFVEMLTYALAAAIALKLTGDENKLKNMSTLYLQAKDTAQAVDGNETYEEAIFYNPLLKCRQ